MNKEAFLSKKPLGKNEFEDGIEFGCMTAWIWYLLWWGLAFYVAAKTLNFIWVFGTVGAGFLIGIALKEIVMLFLLK